MSWLSAGCISKAPSSEGDRRRRNTPTGGGSMPNRLARLRAGLTTRHTGSEAEALRLAEAATDALRQNLAARKARGRWVRLRAAWRGE
jgi:hypothetical protein